MPGNPPHLPRASRLCRRVPSASSSLHLLPLRFATRQGCRAGPATAYLIRIGTAERLQERLFKTGGASGEAPPLFWVPFKHISDVGNRLYLAKC